jgi:RHS repeat-associated protein
VHADHLGTPRVITRPSDNKIMWRWDSTEAFGNTLPNENPAAGGTFTYNLRHPGQQWDKETNNFYNYFRDYDASTGRYVQSDPIGLLGGVSTYAYVSGSPTSSIDEPGLWSVSFGYHFGGGGQISFGQDAITGRGFIDGKVGVGLGLTAKYDPLGGIPNSTPSKCNCGGIGVRAWAEVGKLQAGPIDTKILDAAVGVNFNISDNGGNYCDPAETYAYAKPKAQLQSKTWGLDAKLIAAGIGGTIYSGIPKCRC